MIDSAKILKLCNDIEDIVTDMDVHCDSAGWAECMEIISKIKQIGEELKETQARMTNGDNIRAMTDDEELLIAIGTGCYRCAYRNGECDSGYGEGCIAGNLKWLKQEV